MCRSCHVNTIKVICDKLRDNILIKKQTLKTFSLRYGIRQGCSFSPFLNLHCTGSASSSNQAREKGHQMGKEESNYPCLQTMLYVENPRLQ